MTDNKQTEFINMYLKQQKDTVTDKYITPTVEYQVSNITNIIPSIIKQNKNTCPSAEEYKDIKPHHLGDVLQNSYMLGPDMNSVACTFKNIFSNLTIENDVLSPEIQKWLTDFKIIKGNHSNGAVYISHIGDTDAQVIIKTIGGETSEKLLKREYFVGRYAINKLRYKIPTFMYTLGMFNCSGSVEQNSEQLCESKNGHSNPYLVLEKIPGKTLRDLLVNRELTFEQWLVIFFQILLSLEIAQREIKFTHFDLHTSNVMIRNTESYNISLDNVTYTINNPIHTPVIIDYGMSAVEIDGHTIGEHDMSGFGIVNFMVAGYDMYKILIFSAMDAADEDNTDNVIFNKIQKIFDFYDNDPYKINTNNYVRGFNNFGKDYGANLYKYSAIAETPLNFINWLEKTYPTILSNTGIHKSDRKTYIPIQLTSSSILDQVKYMSEFTIKCNTQPSYVITKYNIMILEKYNIEVKNQKIDELITTLKIFIGHSKRELYELDKLRLEKVFDIKLPNKRKYRENLQSVMNLDMNLSLDRKAKNYILILNNYESYKNELQPYLVFYFTILQLNLEDSFSDWISRFKSSEIYEFYFSHLAISNGVDRWAYSLTNYNTE